MAKVPPARSQENWAHQGQAPVGTLTRKPHSGKEYNYFSPLPWYDAAALPTFYFQV